MTTDKRVLIIEDESMILTILSKFIQKLVDPDVPITAINATEGLKKLKENPKNVVIAIIDYNLPDMSCKSLVDNIKEINSDIKIFLSTGLSAADLVGETGCDGSLQKPFTIPDIKKIVDTIDW